MLKYLRESLHWAYLLAFKPFTFEAEAMKLTYRQVLFTLLKSSPITLVIYLLFLATVLAAFGQIGFLFNWNNIFMLLASSILFGPLSTLFIFLADKVLDKFLSGGNLPSNVLLRSGLFAGMFGILALSTRGTTGLANGVIFGLTFGLIGWLSRGAFNAAAIGIISGIIQGLVAQYNKGLTEVLNFALASPIGFLITYFRPFYLVPHFLQYLRSRKSDIPFEIFHYSPIYWDEVIATPLPCLKEWLVDLVKRDAKCGMEEILFVAQNRPFQRKAAFKALLAVAEMDLQRIHDVKTLAMAAEVLKGFPTEIREKDSLKGLPEVQRRVKTISTLAQDYEQRLTLDGQLKVLEELRSELESFRSAMSFTAAPVGTTFQPLAARWLEMVKRTDEELRQRLSFHKLNNPYIAGNPLEKVDENIFVGRRDIIRAIEAFILNTNQRPSLLLYGRRRTGKSSTLKNLPRLLSSQFEPVYMDCQDAKWHESDQAFCFNLAQEIFSVLQQRETVRGIAQPQLEQFEKNAFTRLDQYLDQFEKLIQQRGKRILLSFDEYEALEESITNADISKNVLGKLRNIIQHRERIVVLVSGSHRFDELTGLNWASYLINMRTLEISFLDEAAARELLTQPVPKLQYEDGVVDEIVRITHCQPYLLQAVASELVNYLNDQQRTTATREDLEVTVGKVLVSAGSYFANTWTEGRSDEEQAVMLASAMGEAVDWAAHPAALRNLLNAEIVEANGDGYALTIDLFRRWILKHKAPVLPRNP